MEAVVVDETISGEVGVQSSGSWGIAGAGLYNVRIFRASDFTAHLEGSIKVVRTGTDEVIWEREHWRSDKVGVDDCFPVKTEQKCTVIITMQAYHFVSLILRAGASSARVRIAKTPFSKTPSQNGSNSGSCASSSVAGAQISTEYLPDFGAVPPSARTLPTDVIGPEAEYFSSDTLPEFGFSRDLSSASARQAAINNVVFPSGDEDAKAHQAMVVAGEESVISVSTGDDGLPTFGAGTPSLSSVPIPASQEENDYESLDDQSDSRRGSELDQSGDQTQLSFSPPAAGPVCDTPTRVVDGVLVSAVASTLPHARDVASQGLSLGPRFPTNASAATDVCEGSFHSQSPSSPSEAPQTPLSPIHAHSSFPQSPRSLQKQATQESARLLFQPAPTGSGHESASFQEGQPHFVYVPIARPPTNTRGCCFFRRLCFGSKPELNADATACQGP